MFNDLLQKVFYRDTQNISREIGPVGGGIFITNVQPSSNTKVVSVVNNPNAVSDVVQSFESDTQLVDVTLEWDGVAGEWNGYPTLYSLADDLSILNQMILNTATQIGNTRRFTATVQLNLLNGNLTGKLHATIYGRNHLVDYSLLPEGPSIFSVQWGSLPNTQTELKSGDTIDLEVVINSNDVAKIVFENYGVSDGIEYIVTPVIDTPVAGKSTVTITGFVVANGINSLQNLGFKIKAKNAFGSVGSTFEVLDNSNDYDTENGLNSTLPVNDTFPTFSFSSIVYPIGQQALKNSETADITVNVINAGAIPEVLYDSPNGDLSVTNPTVLSSLKTVTRISGSYNIASNNYRITVTRKENNATSVYQNVVWIANIPVVLTMIYPYARLRSGGNMGTSIQNYTLTLNSTQRLLSAPLVTAPVGTLGSFSYAPTNTSFTATMSVHDNDAKGTHSYSSVSVFNLAGIETTAISTGFNYILGGFVKREISFEPFRRQSYLGVNVALTAKLQATNLSKGTSGSLNTTYKSVSGTIQLSHDEVDRYTISDGVSSGGIDVGYATANSSGDYVYNLDALNANSNSTGDLKFEVEEIV